MPIADGGSHQVSVAVVGSDVVVTVDGVATSRPASDVTNVTITGGSGDDTLAIPDSLGGLAVSFDGGTGDDTVRGPSADTTWNVTGAGSGSVAGVAFAGVESLQGADGNRDTFVVATGASVRSVDGGSGGFDSLTVTGATAVSTPSGRHSGVVVLDGSPIAYGGLEPLGYFTGTVVINGRDLGGSTELLDKDLLKVSPYLDGSVTPACAAAGACIQVRNYEGPLGLVEIAELSYFTVSTSSAVTINGGLGTDTVEFMGDFVDPGVNLTVNAEQIKVNSGVTVDVGGGDLTFNAETRDNGISLVGVTTTIPVLGASALVDISPDNGDWASGDGYDAGDVVVDAFDGMQYRALVDVSSGGAAPHANASWGLAGSARLIGNTVNLIALAGTLRTTVSGAQNLTGAGDTLTVASVAGFADDGTFTIGVDICTYTGRNTTNHQFTGVSGCVGPVADLTVVRKDILENGSDTGLRHAALELEYYATVDVHGDSHITATGNVTLASTIDVTAAARAAAGPNKGNWNGTVDGYSKGDVVTDTDGKKYAATDDFIAANLSNPHPKDDTGLLGKWTLAEQKDSSVALASVIAFGKTRLSGTSVIAASSGAVALSSNVKTDITGAADSTLAGSGAGIAVVVIVTSSEAFIDSNAATPVTATSLTVSADTDNSAPTTATTSPGGATDNDKDPNDADRANGQAKTADGDIPFAGALAVTVLVATTNAFVAPKDNTSVRTLHAGSLHKIHAGTKNASSAKADGSPANGGPGVGVAVGVNITTLTTHAYVAGNVVVNATTTTVEAIAPAAGTSTTSAEAKSGAGGANVSVAGALAVNVLVADTIAEVQLAAPVAVNGDLTLTALSGFNNTAKAEASTTGGNLGIGGSVAVNVVDDTTVAQVSGSEALTGVDDLTMSANSTDAMTTTAKGGADGGDGGSFTLGASVAISISNVTTTGRVGAGSAMTLTGKLDAKAEQSASADTTAEGATLGGNVGIGAAIAVTFANHLVDSQLQRSLAAAGDISLKAFGTSTTTSSSTASAKGAKGEGGDSSGKDVNGKGDDQLKLGKDKSQDTSAASTPEASTAESGGSSVSVAAAISFNVVTAKAIAHVGIPTGALSVVSTGGKVSLASKADADAKATATGNATNGGTATIGAAVAVNLAKLTNEASIDAAANVTTNGGLALCASMGTSASCGANAGAKHAFEATAISGADGGGTVGVAGSLALNIVDAKTLAVIHAHPSRGPPAVIITGISGDLSLSAESRLESTTNAKAIQTGGGSSTVGVGASVAINLVNHTTQAGLEDGGSIAQGPTVSGARDITLSAVETDTLTTTAEGGAGGATVTINPNVAIVIANVSTSASIGRGSSIGAVHPSAGISGKIDAKASQSVAATTMAKGAISSPGSVGVALSLGLAIIDASVDASSRRSLHAGGPISFQADGNVSSNTTAEASAKGAEKDSENVNQKADKNLTDAKDKQQTNTGSTTSKTETPKAATAEDSGNSVSVAGAVAINVLTSRSTATLANGTTVRSDTGKVTLKTSANTDAIAKAKGDTAVDGSVGVGAGVAINHVDLTNRASAGAATINASGLDVQATMRNVSGNTQHFVSADAYAGASKASSVGIAGALALNIVLHTTEAVVPAGANVTLNGGAVTLNAASDEKDIAKASGKQEGGGSVGIGAAVAINILVPTLVRAEAEDGAGLSLTNGTTITVTASGLRTVETSVEAGSAGGTAITPAVAFVLMKDDVVKARLGTSGTSLTGSGAVTVTATHTADVSKTKADAEAASSGGSAAVGADVALNVVLDWSTTAEIARDVTGSSVTIEAVSTVTSVAEAKASASGNKSKDDDASTKTADQTSDSQINDNPNTDAKVADGTTPSANDSAADGNGTANSESSKNGGGVGVAAALAVSWVETVNTAAIGANASIRATGAGGQVKVSARNQTDTTTKAIGASTDLSSSTSIGAAVGLNVVEMANNALVGVDADVTSEDGSITVEAITPVGQRNDFVSWGLAAAGGKSDASVAGSVAIQVITFTTTASIGKGADLEAKGSITVNATAPLGLMSLALAGGLSTGGTAVGGAIVVDILNITTRAFVDSGTPIGDRTQLDALGGISVTATASLATLDPGIPKVDAPDITSVAFAGGAGGGSASVTGAVIVDILNLTTHAQIGDGARINQTPNGAWGSPGSGQSLTVTAIDSTSVFSLGGSLSLTTGSASVGVGLVVTVVNKDIRASIGKAGVASFAGDVTIHSTSTEDFFLLGIHGAGSTGTSFVGSVVVLVMNQGGGSPGVYAYVDQGATLHSNGNVDLRATTTLDELKILAGGLAFGSSNGISVSAAVLVRDARTKAWIGQDADIEAKGPIGLTINASQTEDIYLIAAGGTGGGTAGIAGSAVVDILDNETHAYVDRGATVNGVNTGAASTQGIAISASDTTEILGIAGTISVGGTASVGAGVDVEAITKSTKAWIGADTTANVNGDLTVDANSSESITSIAVGGGFGGSAAVNVNAAVSVFSITTQAFVDHGAIAGDGAILTANGSVRIAADENLDLDLVAGNVSGSGSAAVGAGAAIPVITKTTTAFIGNHARVTGKGGGGGVSVRTGTLSLAQTDTRFNRRDGGIGQHDRPRIRPRVHRRRAGHVRQRWRSLDWRTGRQRRRHRRRRGRAPVGRVLRHRRRRPEDQAQRHAGWCREGACARERPQSPDRADAGSERQEGHLAAVRPVRYRWR